MSERPSAWTIVGIFTPIVSLAVGLFLTYSAVKAAEARIDKLEKKLAVTTSMLEGFAHGLYSIEEILTRIEHGK